MDEKTNKTFSLPVVNMKITNDVCSFLYQPYHMYFFFRKPTKLFVVFENATHVFLLSIAGRATTTTSTQTNLKH